MAKIKINISGMLSLENIIKGYAARIGSVILLKGGRKKLMIYGIKQTDMQARNMITYLCFIPKGI